MSRQPSHTLRLALITAGWLLLVMLLVPWLTAHAPLWLQRSMSMQTFRLLTQVTTTALGVGACVALLPDARSSLALRPAKPSSFFIVAALAPMVWIAATIIALRVAMPTLIDELMTRGAGASRQNAGAFGRELSQSSALSVMATGVVMAAICEELLFRGALWELVAQLVRARNHSARRYSGVIATVVSALAFGYAHHDLPGGVGIVRVVSTTFLGLATGVVRQASGSLLAAMLLHALYNAASVAMARGWFGGSKVTLFEAPVPSIVLVAALVGGGVASGIAWCRRKTRRLL